MKTITATEASRNFSNVLDAVERGEEITVTRNGVPLVRLLRAHRNTGGALREALADLPPLDDGFEAELEETRALLTLPEPAWNDD